MRSRPRSSADSQHSQKQREPMRLHLDHLLAMSQRVDRLAEHTDIWSR